MMAYRAALSLALVFSVTLMVKADTYQPAQPPKPQPTSAPKCGENERLGCAPCEDKPCSEILNPRMMKCDVRCKKSCVCEEGFFRQDDKCVPASKCNVKCPRNMVYNHDAPEPKTCDTQEDRKPRCVCKKGFILESDGSNRCIDSSQC